MLSYLWESKNIRSQLGSSLFCTLFALSLFLTNTNCNSSVDDKEVGDENEIFFDDFESDSLDSQKWKIALRNWGGKDSSGNDYNGGVHPDNVSLSRGNLILAVHGDEYEGNPLGINKDGSTRDNGKRVGAAIATKDYFASGRYEIRMKVAPVPGVCSAPWTFHYRELYPGDEGYIPNSQGYMVLNHEIDMEMPGRPSSAIEDISFSWALLNTWVGERGNEYTALHTELSMPQDDGDFHVYRFDWHTGDSNEEPRVEFFVDEVKVATSTTHIPSAAGRLWLGAWFPRNWAGVPAFNRSEMVVDWIRITPFREKGDENVPETYPNHGWDDE